MSVRVEVECLCLIASAVSRVDRGDEGGLEKSKSYCRGASMGPHFPSVRTAEQFSFFETRKEWGFTSLATA